MNSKGLQEKQNPMQDPYSTHTHLKIDPEIDCKIPA